MSGRSVLITGGAGGLGSAVTAGFLAEGWRVVVPTLAKEPVVDGALAVPETDLTDPAAVAAATAVAAHDAGAPLRAVVNLAGGFASGGHIHETDVAEFERQFTLNLRPTYLVTQATVPHLVGAGGGAIVCVGSRAAVAPFPGAAGYVVSKAAVVSFAQTVAVEYRDKGVRCNVILPSVIDTPGNRAAQPDADHSRWVTPEEIAGIIRFLAGPASAPTSGAVIPVYGRA